MIKRSFNSISFPSPHQKPLSHFSRSAGPERRCIRLLFIIHFVSVEREHRIDVDPVFPGLYCRKIFVKVHGRQDPDARVLRLFRIRFHIGRRLQGMADGQPGIVMVREPGIFFQHIDEPVVGIIAGDPPKATDFGSRSMSSAN